MPRKYIKKNVKKRYSETDLKLAIESVSNGSSIREASNTYHIPYTTLNSHVNCIIIQDEPGRPPKFNKEEEDCLEQAVLALQSWGVPLTIDEFLNLSKHYSVSLNKNHLFRSEKPTYDWMRSFLKRHQNLILKKSIPLEKKRAVVTSEQIEKWFELLSKIVKENNLEDHPGQIFNCDESGMSDSISYSKVLVHRQTTNAYRVQGGSGGKSYISVMYCASATGFLLPPFIIYKSKRLFQEWCVGGPQGTGFSNSESGWMNHDLFYQWLEQIFIPHTKDLPRPILLIMDGYGSHFSVETLRLAVQHNIIILCLPPNATHIVQPLDVVFFNPLKIEWKRILKNEYTRTKFKVIGKARFPSLLNEMWNTDAIKTKTNIVKSFMKAGVFPLNPNSIDHSRILQNIASVVSSSSDIPTDTSDNDLTRNSSISNNLQTFDGNTNTTTNVNSSMVNVAHSPELTSSSFTSSHQAISVLTEVLQETMMSNDSINDDSDDSDDDEDYLPPVSISTSSITVTSKKQQEIQTKRKSTSNNDRSVYSQRGNKRKKVSWDIIDFDDVDEDDEILNLSPSKPQPPLQTTRRSQSKDLPTLKIHQSTPSQQRKKQNQASSEINNIEILDEQENVTLHSSSANSQQSLNAINNTLKLIFAPSSQSPKKSTKRTVLKRPNGQIMTEKDVIEQMEEKNNKKRSNQSRSMNKKSNESQRRKLKKTDSSVASTTSSTISIGSMSSPMVTKQQLTSTNNLSPAVQYIAEPDSNIHSSSNSVRGAMQTNFGVLPQTSSINNSFNTVSNISQPLVFCSQCQKTVDSPVTCSLCDQTLCTTCINQEKFNSCLFCILRFSYSL